MLSFTQYTQSVSLGKCSTIVSNRFTILSFNIVRCSNSRLPSALGPTDVDSYIVCLAYVVRLLSLIKSVFPKVVNSCIPTIYLVFCLFYYLYISISISALPNYFRMICHLTEWWSFLTYDGFKSHVNVTEGRIFFAEETVKVGKEEDGTSAFNQAHDKFQVNQYKSQTSHILEIVWWKVYVQINQCNLIMIIYTCIQNSPVKV